MDIGELDTSSLNCLKRGKSDISPAIVIGDFDGNGFQDYAFLLRSIDGKLQHKKCYFVVLLQFANNKYDIINILEMDYRNDIVIFPIKSGTSVEQTESIDNPIKKAILKNTAVELIYMGKGTIVYYWDNTTKKIESITTSD
jgi:hypothetical protein